jgi:hypothetical protein
MLPMPEEFEMMLRFPRGDVSVRTTGEPEIVVAQLMPEEPRDGAIVTATEHRDFPGDAWSRRDEAAIRTWLETAYPRWCD